MDGENVFDFIFIDASHSKNDVYDDATLAWKLLVPGGIMLFDDVLHKHNYDNQYGVMHDIGRFLRDIKHEGMLSWAANGYVYVKKEI
jgi:predicted O-methyltransferase YrrM